MTDASEKMTVDASGPMTEDEKRFVRDHAFTSTTNLAGDWREFLGPNFPHAAEGALDAWAMAFCNLSTHEDVAKMLEYKANILRLLAQKERGEAH